MIKYPQTTPQSYKISKSKPCSCINTIEFASALNPFTYCHIPSNNLIDSFINRTANLVDRADAVATIYNNKVAKLSVLHATWAYKDAKKGALV